MRTDLHTADTVRCAKPRHERIVVDDVEPASQFRQGCAEYRCAPWWVAPLVVSVAAIVGGSLAWLLLGGSP